MSREIEYEPDYYAADYPSEHPYFIYMAEKYQKIVDALQVGLIDRYRSERLEAYLFELNDEYIWSDDEELCEEPGFVSKREVKFYKHDLQELCAEAFKPSRVFYALSLDPDYEFD